MKSLSVEKVFEDKLSGKNVSRPGLKEMIAFVRSADEVIVESISRLARSTRDLLDIIDQLDQKGVSFVSKKENLETKTPQGRFVLTIFGALAALEREQIRERQMEGYAAARARGKKLGRPGIQRPSNWDEVFSDWKAEAITAVDAVSKLGISRSSFYKLVGQEQVS
jgi:DNA invertase Pin-like site-specific DNA recombinase